MSLPEELAEGFWQELSQFEEEIKMPYVTNVERYRPPANEQETIKSTDDLSELESVLA